MGSDTAFDLYSMARLGPRETGLPFAVYISERQGDGAPSIRVGDATSSIATISIEGGQETPKAALSEADLERVREWLHCNHQVLIGYWDRSIESTADALDALKRIPSAARCSS